jgi:hypothetical protein
MKHISNFSKFINESESPNDLSTGLNELCQQIVRAVNIKVNDVDSSSTLTARWVPGNKEENSKVWQAEFSCKLSDFYPEEATAYLDIDWDYYLVTEDGDTGTVTHAGSIELKLNSKPWESSVYPRIDSFAVDQSFDIARYGEMGEIESISGDGDGKLHQFSEEEQYFDLYPQIIADRLVEDFHAANDYLLTALPEL